jgi:hypothetical protein
MTYTGTALQSNGSRLQEISAQINAEHSAAEHSLRASVEHAIRAGELLIEAKRSVLHGSWSDWLQQNLTFSERLAQTYMRIARLPIEKRNAVADLPLREVLSAIRSREKHLAVAEDRRPSPVPTTAVVAELQEEEEEEEELSPRETAEHRRDVFLVRANEAMLLAVYNGTIFDEQVARVAQKAADAWSELATILAGKIPNRRRRTSGEGSAS